MGRGESAAIGGGNVLRGGLAGEVRGLKATLGRSRECTKRRSRRRMRVGTGGSGGAGPVVPGAGQESRRRRSMVGATGAPPAKASSSDRPGPALSGYLARPNFSAASGSGRHGIVLAHGFPEAGQKAGAPSYGYPQLATRLAAETGAVVLTFDFRGTGASEGDFSLGGWRADLVTGIETLRDVPGIEEIWLVGFAAGGTLSICAAGRGPVGGRGGGAGSAGRVRETRRRPAATSWPRPGRPG